jgi:hypothetical protein
VILLGVGFVTLEAVALAGLDGVVPIAGAGEELLPVGEKFSFDWRLRSGAFLRAMTVAVTEECCTEL